MFIHAWRFIVLTRVRRGELCGLQRQDIDGSTLFLHRSINKHSDQTDDKTEAARHYLRLHHQDIRPSFFPIQNTPHVVLFSYFGGFVYGPLLLDL